MTPAEILDRVHTCCSAILSHDLPIDGFDPTLSFAAIGADSLDHVEIVMAIECEFGINIPDPDAEAITTVQQAVDYLQTHA